MTESGVPGFAAQAWAAFLAPAGTPRAIVQKVNGELDAVLAKPGIKERLISLGAEPVETTPEQTTAFFKSEIEVWGGAVKSSEARAD